MKLHSSELEMMPWRRRKGSCTKLYGTLCQILLLLMPSVTDLTNHESLPLLCHNLKHLSLPLLRHNLRHLSLPLPSHNPCWKVHLVRRLSTNHNGLQGQQQKHHFPTTKTRHSWMQKQKEMLVKCLVLYYKRWQRMVCFQFLQTICQLLLFPCILVGINSHWSTVLNLQLLSLLASNKDSDDKKLLKETALQIETATHNKML